MGAGKPLCIDCTEELVKENSAEIAWLRTQVKKERTWMIVGASVVGFLLGSMMATDLGVGGFFGYLILGAFIGGSLGTIVNGFTEHGPWIGVPMIIVSPVMTIVRYVRRVNQIKQCDEILASDARIIQEMRDYFAYTQEMENSAGVDLTTLANQGGSLFGNTYANAVISKGERAAQAELRQGAVQIAANGEIIRGFDRRLQNRSVA
jgi:uncharacterized membrane protein (DUF485 family)